MERSNPEVRRALHETRLSMWMPYGRGNREWLHGALGSRVRPRWNKATQRWEIARSHLRLLTLELADRFGRCDVYLEFSTQERCDTRCRNAMGDDCTCSCLGENHGGAAYWKFWKQVGETTLIAQDRQERHYTVLRSPGRY